MFFSPRRLLAISVVSALLFAHQSADARLFGRKKEESTSTKSADTNESGATRRVPISDGTAGDTNGNAPVVVAPSSLVDLTTAKFARLDLDLKDAAFLEASVRDFRLIAENMDMNNGTLETLAIQVDSGVFQDFTVDSLRMYSRGAFKFDTMKLLNNKVLEFSEPAAARVRVGVSQQSLNKFLNAPFVLQRLSGAAKKRVPILSTLARQDVNFGFSFTKGDVKLEPDNRIRLAMDSKLGMGKVGMPVTLTAETQLNLADGWVTLSDTKLHTGSQTVPHDMATKIVNRINDLSKWGTQSDDIKFQFTDLKVVPDDRLELEGTAQIKRLRFARNQEPEPKTELHGPDSDKKKNDESAIK